MASLHMFLTILMVGAIGGIVYTVATHPEAIKASGDAADKLYKTGIAGELGAVA